MKDVLQLLQPCAIIIAHIGITIITIIIIIIIIIEDGRKKIIIIRLPIRFGLLGKIYI